MVTDIKTKLLDEVNQSFPQYQAHYQVMQELLAIQKKYNVANSSDYKSMISTSIISKSEQQHVKDLLKQFSEFRHTKFTKALDIALVSAHNSRKADSKILFTDYHKDEKLGCNNIMKLLDRG